MKHTFLLLKAELKMILNSTLISDKNGIKKMFTIIIVVLALGYLAWFIGVGVSVLIKFISELLVDYPDLLMMTKVNILSAMSLALFFLMFVTGFNSIYSSLFDSGDMNFLIGTPVSIGSIYTAKFLKALWTNLISIIPFNLPIWIGFGLASDAGIMYYVMTVIGMILAVLLFTSIVSIVVIFISRYISSQKMKQLVMVGSLVLGVVFVIVVQALSSFMAKNQGIGFESFVSIGSWDIGSKWFLPHIWVVKTPLAMLNGYGFSLLESFLPLLLFSVGTFLLSIKVAQKLFLKGWSSSKEYDDAKSKNSTKPKDFKSFKKGFNTFKGQIGSMLYKDLLIWKRQPILWYGVIIAVIALLFFIFNISSSDVSNDVSGSFSIIRETLLFMIIFLSSYSSGGLSVFSISMDGEGLWLLKSSPISARKYYLSKMIVVMTPGIIIAVLGLVGMSIFTKLPQNPIYETIPLAVCTLSVIAAMQLLTDLAKPNFNIKITGFGGGKEMNDPFKSSVMIFSSAISSLVVVMLFALPTYYTSIPFLVNIGKIIITIISLIIVLALISVLHVFMGKKAVEKIESILCGR